MNDEYILSKYLRISDEDNRYGDSQSIEGQRALLDNFIDAHPELRDARRLEFVDDGYSGTNFQRPGVQAMLEKARAGAVHCIIVKDFSRFGRNYIDVGDYLEQIFPFLRVRFISVNDGFDSDKAGGVAGDVGIAFKNLCNDYYCKDLSRKIKTGIQTKWESGQLHMPFAPYGYMKRENRLVADETTAPIVRRIFDMALNGVGMKAIAQTLNAGSLPTPARYRAETTKKKTGYNSDNIWLDGTVRKILHDIRYTGLLVQGTTRCDVVGSRRHRNLPKELWRVSPVRHEAIVSNEEFEKVQGLISSGRQTGHGERRLYPLSGKVRCGGCGHAMSRSNSDNPSYSCNYKSYYEAHACPRKGIKASVVDDTVLAALKNLFDVFAAEERKRIDRASERTAASMGLMRELQTLQRRIDGIGNEKLELYKRYGDGEIGKEEYFNLRAAADARLRKLTEQTAALEKRIRNNKAVPDAGPFVDKMRTLRFDGILTREVVDALIDRVLVYGKDRIEIIWKFSDAALAATMEREETVNATE